MVEELRLKRIDKNSPLPLYYQLKEILQEYIRGKPSHSPLPSESELCAHFEISRPTVRQTMSELTREGLIYRKRGMGSFVAEAKIDRDFVLWRGSFSDDVRRRGSVPQTRVLELSARDADHHLAEQLGLETGQKLAFLKRRRFVDSQPILIWDSYLPLERLAGFLDLDLNDTSLHQTLEEFYGFRIDRTRRSLEALGAPAEIADFLDLDPGDPVQYFENTVYLRDGSIIEYSQGWYRGDRIRFTFEYKRTSQGISGHGDSLIRT